MKPILIIGIVLGVLMITVGMFMYFYKLDTNVGNNTKHIEFLQKNDSIFLGISKRFQYTDSISRRNDSMRMELLLESLQTIRENNMLLKDKNKLSPTKSSHK